MTRSSQLQETKLVSIKSGAYKLGVLEVDLRNLIVEHHIQVSTNYEGKPAISPNDLYKLAEDQCLLKLRNNYRVERY